MSWPLLSCFLLFRTYPVNPESTDHVDSIGAYRSALSHTQHVCVHEFGGETLPLLAEVFRHGFLVLCPEEGGGSLEPVLLFSPAVMRQQVVTLQ